MELYEDIYSRSAKTILIIIITVSALSIAVSLSKRPQEIYIQDPNYIPSVREIQQQLKDTGKERYDPGKVDGIPGPKTIKAWDNHNIDQFAIRAIEGE